MTLSRYLSGYKEEEASESGPRPTPPPLVPFCFSYNVYFCLLTLNVFLTYRFSCGTMKTEFYFQPEFYSIFRAYPIQVNHSYVKQVTGHCLSLGGGGGGIV